MERWPDHLPDWVWWLLVVVMPAAYGLRMAWQLWGPQAKPPPTRMTADEAIALVHAAIREQWPDWSNDYLHIAEWPRPANAMTWTVRQATIGSWWSGRVDDLTGEVRDVRHFGVR